MGWMGWTRWTRWTRWSGLLIVDSCASLWRSPPVQVINYICKGGGWMEAVDLRLIQSTKVWLVVYPIGNSSGQARKPRPALFSKGVIVNSFDISTTTIHPPPLHATGDGMGWPGQVRSGRNKVR